MNFAISSVVSLQSTWNRTSYSSRRKKSSMNCEKLFYVDWKMLRAFVVGFRRASPVGEEFFRLCVHSVHVELWLRSSVQVVRDGKPLLCGRTENNKLHPIDLMIARPGMEGGKGRPRFMCLGCLSTGGKFFSSLCLHLRRLDGRNNAENWLSTSIDWLHFSRRD
jgi:hypothetical protein